MKLVKIGEYYALRKGFFFNHVYLDLVKPGFWWSKSSGYFRDCLTTDKNHKQFIRLMKDEKV